MPASTVQTLSLLTIVPKSINTAMKFTNCFNCFIFYMFTLTIISKSLSLQSVSNQVRIVNLCYSSFDWEVSSFLSAFSANIFLWSYSLLLHQCGSHFCPVLRSLQNSSHYVSAGMRYLERSRKREVDPETDESTRWGTELGTILLMLHNTTICPTHTVCAPCASPCCLLSLQPGPAISTAGNYNLLLHET